jgi:type I restriction enzyme S subunit
MSINNHIPAGFKMTDYGFLPEDWGIVALGDILGYVDYRVNEEGYHDIPILSMTRHSGLILQNEKFEKRVASRDIKNYKIVKKGQIVYGFPMDEGVIYGLKKYEIGAVSPVYEVWQIKNDRVNDDFLDKLLRTPMMISTYSRLTSNTVQRRRIVSKKDFQKIKVPVPSLTEQKAIAKILSSIQRSIETQDKIISTSLELKKSLMRHLFTYGPVPVTDADKVLLKNTEIGLVPEHWEVKSLIDAATLQRGKDLPKQNQIFGQYPIVGSSGVIGYHKEFVCVGPGVVTGRSGSIGNYTYIEENYWPHNTGLYVKDFHGNNPKFIYYLFHLVDFRKYATGVSVPTLNRNFVHSAIVAIPPLSEQVQIVMMLSTVDKKIESEEKRKTALQTLFKTMLHNLMTGKVRVKESEAQMP